MKNSENLKKKKHYFLFFSYNNLVNLSLRFTKIQTHAPKIYKTNRHWTWFSYALKPNTKHKPKFSASICNQTQISTHIFLYFVRNQTQNSKNNEQNPIFSETYLYSISGKVGSVVWVHIFWISSDIGQWQHESTAWVSGVWWWVSSNMDLIVGQSERGIERVLRITWESFFFFFWPLLGPHERERFHKCQWERFLFLFLRNILEYSMAYS